ncbi:hypothetical protein U9M48_042181 [Paspalum notatum var. saurae]|uniref:Uncharacterized protein n=1 Tax=Paspalum notatum var. saurae TaxID=547442 RepID=A0AAQ3UQB6_PASNO
MASPVATVLSIPSAASATPYMAARRNAATGTITDLYPTASPKITLVAAPVRHDRATARTGAYALLFLTCLSSLPKSKRVKRGGRARKVTAAMAAVMSTVEMRIWCLRAGPTSSGPLTSATSVATSVVAMHTSRPTALTSSGYIIAVKLWSSPKEEMEATNSAAHDDSAYEPNRSDPIPAMSPTLSPTLSAITYSIHRMHAHQRSIDRHTCAKYINTTSREYIQLVASKNSR